MNRLVNILLGFLLVLSFTTTSYSRDQIKIVGSSTVYPYATVVAEKFGKGGKFKTPVIESTGTGGGMKLFCAGVGANHPDITNASRAIKTKEKALCEKNGVAEIIEIVIGNDGLTLAHSLEAPSADFNQEQLYLALAEEVPVDGKLVANPTIEELENSTLDLVVAGTEEGVLMVESEAKELPESTMLEAVMFGHDFYQTFIKEIQAFAGKTEIKNFEVPTLPEFYEGLQKDISSKIADPIREAYGLTDKQERSQKLGEIRSSIIENVEDDQVLSATTIIKDIEKDVVRGDIIKNKSRIDGRKLDEVRKITCELDILPRAHGSSLFTRGETQALVVMTLGTGDDEQMIDSLDPMHKQHFMLHYNFPPYSVGEVGRSGFTSRREIGHGKLAWRAVNPMLPSKEDFPYTLRLVSEITESNGSSSMATVCGSSLALMSAGVPIKKHIGGIAMGLIKDGDDFVVLSDILGDEDHLGDMDFKVAGTMDGITSLQMDIKITSITKEIMEIALNQASGGRKHIIEVMSEALPEARTKFSKHAPQVISISIDKAKIKDVIGSGGKVIRNIVEVSGAKLEVNDDGIVKIASSNEESINIAKQMVEDIVAEPEIGKIYNGKVVKIVEFGAFVNFMGARDGLLHVSQISQKRVENVTDVLSEGQEVQVKVLDVDRAGKVKLSMKEV